MKTAYEQIIVLNARKKNLDSKINSLKPFAVKELRALDYSYDEITRMLFIGKITAMKIMKKEQLQ